MIAMVQTFSTSFSLTSFVNQVNKLSNNQKSSIKKAGFGNLLLIPNYTLNKNLILELMERWDCKKKSFAFPPGNIKITQMDVALILGLSMMGEPVVLKRNRPLSDLEKNYRATIERREIKVSYLKSRLRTLKDTADEDFLRSFLLFTLGVFLLPNASGTIDSRYLFLLEDLDKVSCFAWGKVVLHDLCNWMDTRKKGKETQYMGGCLLFLQVWSYEHIDIARPECDVQFPRASRWKNTSSRPILKKKFEELQKNQIIGRLQLTSEETTNDIIRDLLEIQNYGLEFSSTSEFSFTSDTVHDDKLLIAESLDKKFEEVVDSGIIVINESLVKEEDDMDISSTRQCSYRIDKPPGNERKLSDKQVPKMEDSKVVIINESLEVVDDDMSISCTPQSISRIDPASEEDHQRTRISVLEEQNTELIKENNELRSENSSLRNRLLSLETLTDGFERLLLSYEVNEKEC